MAPTLEPGAVVAGFRVLSPLGEGAMGSVFLAEDAAGGRVALKQLAPSLAQDERFRRRFLREARLAASLNHPYVVPVVASGDEDGVLYLAMAYVEGVDLRELLRREGRLEPERALQLTGQVADALDAAHAAGLIHRDVKPGNILVASSPPNERALVCDFGLARHVSSVGSLTGDRGFVGTIDYVPPEQIEGKQLDGRADVYSLGCVLFELLTGERPFARDSELASVFAHLNEPAPRITDVRRELPQALDRVFATALAKSPDDRYSTAGELVRAARTALRSAPPDGRRGRRRLVLAALAVAFVLAAVALVVVLAGGRSTPAAGAAAITPASVAGAPLGLKVDDYKGIFGVGWREDTFDTPNFPVLIYFGRALSVWFTHHGGRAVEITTWNRAYRTAAGVGPCSTIGELRNAYGNALRPSKPNTVGGRVYVYKVGHLLFGVNESAGHPADRVTTVGIYSGIDLNYAGFLVASDASCT